ncbi:MAG: PAS domain-containing protein [Anaerolineales bacterium]
MGKKTNTSLKTELQKQMNEEDYLKLAERLNLATHAAQMGIWDWDIQKNELVWDDQMYRLYGLKPNEFGGAYEAWLHGVHPDDRAPSNEASQMAVRGEKEYDTEFRVLWPDGSLHWLKANGQVFRDEKGNPLRMVGVNYDITARKQAEIRLSESEQKFSSLFNKSIYATTLSRLPDGVLVDVNEAFEQDFGYTRQEAIGKTSLELGFNPDAEGRARMLAEIKEHGSARNHELLLRTKHNQMRMFSVNIDLVDIDGQKYILNTTKDITEQKQAEKQIIQMKRLYATLSQVNQTIVRVKDHADLYQSICDVSTKFGEFALAWIGILDAETGNIKPVAASGLDLAQWPFPQVNIHKGDFQNGLAATAIRTSKVVTMLQLTSEQNNRKLPSLIMHIIPRRSSHFS